MKNIYDELYRHSYNRRNNWYNSLALDFANKVGGKILDAGCGRGHAARELIKAGHDVFAIELSSVCCERFLKDIPHECTDIVTHCSKHKYDAIVCMGVLEHIPYEDIDRTLETLSRAAEQALFSIANHSDIQAGVELHIIQEDAEWWEQKLLQFYKRCTTITKAKKLFTFECGHIA